MPATKGNKKKLCRLRFEVRQNRFGDLPLAFGLISALNANPGADVFVLAPTGMGKVSRVGLAIGRVASPPVRVSAFRFLQSLRRYGVVLGSVHICHARNNSSIYSMA